MPSKREAIVSKRRTPKQARATDTIETILEAAARILERDGIAGLTTNRIAERAGISIGTLYGYFPNKQSILLTMGRRLLAQCLTAIHAAIDRSVSGPEAIRAAVHAVLELRSQRREMRRVSLGALIGQGYYDELFAQVYELGQHLSRHASPTISGLDDATRGARAFVLTQALLGIIIGSSKVDATLQQQNDIEAEMVRLVSHFLDDTPLGDISPAATARGPIS